MGLDFGKKGGLFKQNIEDFDVDIYQGQQKIPGKFVGTEEFFVTSDADIETDSEVYVKVKEFTIKSNQDNNSFKFYWRFWNADSNAQAVRSRLYINGVAAGIEQVIEEVITGINDGDKVQLYLRTTDTLKKARADDYRMLTVNQYFKPEVTDTT